METTNIRRLRCKVKKKHRYSKKTKNENRTDMVLLRFQNDASLTVKDTNEDIDLFETIFTSSLLPKSVLYKNIYI